ncbi:unnamed protein product [Schistocephalus solidus]|uniref:Uncharacterized protein n=1 Tax=Schistocephalus solidus TaxID=70667 RepID=A0A183TKX8_SCHSO|nr:unnamed protein product [Schistocephalus solidus]
MPSKQPSSDAAALYSNGCGRCRMPGWSAGLRKSKGMWIAMKGKKFFKAIKAIYGPCIKGTAPLLSPDGTTLMTEKSQILKCRTEHFRSVLNCSSAISEAAIDRPPQVNTNNDLDLSPSLPETLRACNRFPAGKHWDPTQSHWKSTSTAGHG